MKEAPLEGLFKNLSPVEKSNERARVLNSPGLTSELLP
jgi:hypothetical protein